MNPPPLLRVSHLWWCEAFPPLICFARGRPMASSWWMKMELKIEYILPHILVLRLSPLIPLYPWLNEIHDFYEGCIIIVCLYNLYLLPAITMCHLQLTTRSGMEKYRKWHIIHCVHVGKHVGNLVQTLRWQILLLHPYAPPHAALKPINPYILSISISYGY